MAPSSHTVASDANLPRAVSVADDHEWLRHASRRPRRALEALTTTTTQRTIMKARARASRMRTTSYVARRGGVDDVEWTTRSEARGGWGVEGPKPRPRARARRREPYDGHRHGTYRNYNYTHDTRAKILFTSTLFTPELVPPPRRRQRAPRDKNRSTRR
jgi:hypothetical protein